MSPFEVDRRVLCNHAEWSDFIASLPNIVLYQIQLISIESPPSIVVPFPMHVCTFSFVVPSHLSGLSVTQRLHVTNLQGVLDVVLHRILRT